VPEEHGHHPVGRDRRCVLPPPRLAGSRLRPARQSSAATTSPRWRSCQVTRSLLREALRDRTPRGSAVHRLRPGVEVSVEVAVLGGPIPEPFQPPKGTSTSASAWNAPV
jgi:hypothetical protein